MKVCKLYLHRKSYSDADLVLNPKEHADVKLGDIVEIFDREDDGERLLLQVTKFCDSNVQGRDSVSIDENIAPQFNLRAFTDVVVRVVNAADVSLDSVEITFRDQYMGRSEMWRLKTYLTNTCVYSNKKIDYTDMQVRCQVYEMWSQGERVSSGVITEDTKVVFRSNTSMVYLFIQMSSEMWDFDIHGDLFLEKAVNGFLTELFHKWKRLGANHEVTIVLFSRTLYTAKSLEEFPQYMRDCLQQDYKGRFYEDFYRVVIQNERNDDWATVLVQLRKHFTSYESTVLRYHEREGTHIPTAVNSTAAQGNFLEVLNISLNAFEKHYLDRTFDRTGQLSIVITPGVGVFEVDRELTNITKQRVIDNGVGSDLVCVGEQPLHAVPLLKFHNKDTNLTSADDYSLPHWINLSFYSTNKKIAYSNFIPRIKLPPNIANSMDRRGKKENRKHFLSCNQSKYLHKSLFDYDAYDEQIFMPPPAQGTCSIQRVVRSKKTSVPNLDLSGQSSIDLFSPAKTVNMRRKMSDPHIYHGTSPLPATFSSYANTSEALSKERNERRSIMSIAPIVRPGRALINPFDPSHVTIKLTSNRRRWTHIFPKGPTGVLIQQHHYQAIPAKSYTNTHNNYAVNVADNDGPLEKPTIDADHVSVGSSSLSKSFSSNHSDDKVESSRIRATFNLNLSTLQNTTSNNAPTKSFLWGATGEQEWTPALTTGVDWKSLTIPACLPITTDYIPEKRSLHNDYLVSAYTLLPDAVNLDYANSRAVYRKPLSTEEVFKEIAAQRLAQGFQLIFPDEKNSKQSAQISQLSKTTSNVLNKCPDETKELLLSIGRIFHRITLSGSIITVTAYRPRHPYPPINVHYRYRFHAPQHGTYEISGVNFKTEKLENFNWNYMDHYICTRGDVDYPLMESLKYRRYRMYMLPKENLAMNKIIESDCKRCDIFTDVALDNTKQQVEDFVRFIELHMNKLKRQANRKTRVQTNSPFRERVGSNRLPENRPKLSAGQKMNSNATILEIFVAMKHPISGIGFYEKSQSLPACTFLSYEAILWLKTRLDSEKTPLEILEEMRKDKLICHASGDWNKPVVPGFYLYYIVQKEKNSKDNAGPLNDSIAFENEWMEIEIQGCNSLWSNALVSASIPKFLKDTLTPHSWPDYSTNKKIYRHCHLEIETNQKSERMEWGHVKYHTVMQPGYAFEIVVEWVTSSGPIVHDCLYGWTRKAQSLNYQLVPVPADPMAEPFTEKSDPLRGPIFIPLATNFVPSCRSLFEDYDEETIADRMLLFQEAILSRFGFVRCIIENSYASQRDKVPKEYQYIHCSGNMFVLIRCSKNDFLIESPSRQEANVTRCVYGHTDNTNIPKKVGFLWAWNHMIPSKKWKSILITNSAENELFQIKMLKDFSLFCSNSENRLANFWHQCKEIKSRQSAQPLGSTQ